MRVCLSAHVWTPPALGFCSNDHNENTRELTHRTHTPLYMYYIYTIKIRKVTSNAYLHFTCAFLAAAALTTHTHARTHMPLHICNIYVCQYNYLYKIHIEQRLFISIINNAKTTLNGN